MMVKVIVFHQIDSFFHMTFRLGCNSIVLRKVKRNLVALTFLSPRPGSPVCFLLRHAPSLTHSQISLPISITALSRAHIYKIWTQNLHTGRGAELSLCGAHGIVRHKEPFGCEGRNFFLLYSECSFKKLICFVCPT